MRAITYDRYGGPDVLQVEEIPEPQFGAKEVLIRVRAVEVTKSDCEMRSFNFSVKWFWLPLRLALGVRRPRSRVLGMYFAGEIAEVGSDVTGFSVGDEVYGSTELGRGAYAEFASMPATGALAHKPTNMTFVEAAAVPLGGLNALHFMTLAAVQEDERVLINGAGGVIGSHGVQIAKSQGAHVTAVDNGLKRELILDCGADEFVDYTQESFQDRPGFYDVIFDMVPNSSYSGCIRKLNPGGRYLSGNPRLSTMLRSVLTTRFTNKVARVAFAAENTGALERLRQLIESGSIKSIVRHVVSMDEISTGHTLVETEARVGAVVLQV